MSEGFDFTAAASGFGAMGVQSALNARRAKAARAWQKRRYAERYQVTVRDMKKAGINPILAAGSGLGGGGSPSGFSSSVSQPDTGGQMNTAKRIQSEVRFMREQGYNQTSQANTARVLGEKFRTEKRLMDLQIPGAEIEAAIDRSEYGILMRKANRALPSLNTGGSLLKGRNRGKR